MNMGIILDQPLDVPQNKPESFTTLPDGDYTVIITGFEERIVRSGKLSGRVLDATFQVVDGQYSGMTIQGFVPLFADQPKMRDWGVRTLAQIAWACGHGGKQITDTSQVENIPLVIRVTRTEESYTDSETGEEKKAFRNKIEDYIDLKSWRATKRESGSEPKQGYSSPKKDAEPEEKSSGYTASKRKRVASQKIGLELLMPGDDRIQDYPYEYENDSDFALLLGTDGKIWMKPHADGSNLIHCYYVGDDVVEDTKPADQFVINGAAS